MTGPEELGVVAVERAAALACMVRDDGVEAIGAFLDRLDRQDLYGLAVAAAAMVPVDQTTDDLLGWISWVDDLDNPTRWSPENLRAAHAAYNRGLRDPFTVAGERVYNRLRKRSNRQHLRKAG